MVTGHTAPNHPSVQPLANGRVERFFGTLKRYTKQVDLPAANLQIQLNLFSNWYNQVRPHMNLGYRTPASYGTSNLQTNTATLIL
jgi:transposase InsO family protein